MSDTTVIKGAVYPSRRDFLIGEGTSVSLPTKEVRFEVFTYIELPFKLSDYEPQIDWDLVAEQLGNPPRMECVPQEQVMNWVGILGEDRMCISSTYSAYTVIDTHVTFA